MEGPHLCWQKMSKKPLTFPRKLWNVLSEKPLISQLNFSPVKKIDIVYVKIVISILSFFSFLNFFGWIFFSDFSDSSLKFTNFRQNLIFFFFLFRCCSIMYPWLDFTIFFSHACVYFRLYCSRHRQCTYIHFDTLFYYVEKLFFSFGNSTYF